jgi:hypothetical protein
LIVVVEMERRGRRRIGGDIDISDIICGQTVRARIQMFATKFSSLLTIKLLISMANSAGALCLTIGSTSTSGSVSILDTAGYGIKFRYGHLSKLLRLVSLRS